MVRSFESQFAKEYDAFMQETNAYYATYPVDISAQETVLDHMLEENPRADAFTKKSWIYKVIAESCEVKLFRHCPFYFEVATGRLRNSVTAAYPPQPGIDSWLMRKDKTGFLEKFQNWTKLYMDDNIINSTMYIDCAHHAMGIDNVLKYGFHGLMEKAQKRLENAESSRQRHFLESVISAEESVIKLTEKFAQKAEEMLETEDDEIVRARLERIAKCARKCPAYPAESFYEALNTMLYLKELGNSLEAIGFAVLGHIDRILQPYYEKDLEAGILTKEEAKDLIYWFVAMTDARWDLNDTPYGTNTTLNIGGCDEYGKPVFNDITKFVIEAYIDYGFVNPKLQARFSPGAPDEYFELIAALVVKGTNVLSIFNDNTLVKAHVRMGKTLEDARLYVSGGCQEPVLANTELNSRAFCYLNPSKYLLMMIFPQNYVFFENEGIVPISLEGCENFEDFYQRVFYNLKLIVNAITFRFNSFETFWKDYNPCPFFSSTITGCIESGKDVSEGGAKYNGSSFSLVGMGTFIDSMYAVQQAVFLERSIDWEEMKQLLVSDFEANPRMGYYLKNKLPKYGKDEDELGELTGKIYKDMAEVVSWMPNTRGGYYEASLFSFYAYEWMKGTETTPDGRIVGEPLSRGINPAEYVETNTMEIIHSLEYIDLTKYPGCGVTYLDMPITLTENSNDVFVNLLHYFIECGGSVCDFNVVDPDALVDALEHPERHKNLVVRVCGFSARFVTLEKETQIEIINRAKRCIV